MLFDSNIASWTKYNRHFSLVDFVFPIQMMWQYLGDVNFCRVRSKDCVRAWKCPTFSDFPGYRHMICIGKAKKIYCPFHGCTNYVRVRRMIEKNLSSHTEMLVRLTAKKLAPRGQSGKERRGNKEKWHQRLKRNSIANCYINFIVIFFLFSDAEYCKFPSKVYTLAFRISPCIRS